MMRRNPSEMIKRGYSQAELSDLATLGQRFLAIQEYSLAEGIGKGLSEIAPEEPLGWVLVSAARLLQGDIPGAELAAKQALQINRDNPEALLLFICGLLHERDFANAGAYLGEVRDLVERDKHPRLEVAKFMELQLARYAARR